MDVLNLCTSIEQGNLGADTLINCCCDVIHDVNMFTNNYR